jgi:hypothetical protein
MKIWSNFDSNWNKYLLNLIYVIEKNKTYLSNVSVYPTHLEVLPLCLSHKELMNIFQTFIIVLLYSPKLSPIVSINKHS